MATKQMYAHEPFACLVCRRWIGALQHEAGPDDVESESYILCEGCGAVYLTLTRLRKVHDVAKLSPRKTWKLIPDALTPSPVRDIQARIRSGIFRIDRGRA